MRPDFEDLVGRDLEPAERARLERVHELLIAAGPPPEPLEAPIELRPRRRRGVLLALAAALAVAAFALGAALTGPDVEFTETMSGTAAAGDARATLSVYDLDAAGNWPMKVTVSGLPPAASGRPFQLWLRRGDRPAALCGVFRTSSAGTAVVPMNAPYRFDEFDGWVIIEKGSETPLLTT